MSVMSLLTDPAAAIAKAKASVGVGTLLVALIVAAYMMMAMPVMYPMIYMGGL